MFVRENDTYDTILKNIRGGGVIYNPYIHINSKKESYLSQKELESNINQDNTNNPFFEKLPNEQKKKIKKIQEDFT